jgi:predicted RecB family endonuclease
MSDSLEELLEDLGIEDVELRVVLRSLQRIERITMATQQEVDQLVTDVATIKADLDTAKTNIETEFATLESEIGSDVDLTSLKTAIEGLAPQAEALEQLKANPPAAAAPANAANVPAAAAPAADSASSALTPAEIDAQAAQQAGGAA